MGACGEKESGKAGKWWGWCAIAHSGWGQAASSAERGPAQGMGLRQMTACWCALERRLPAPLLVCKTPARAAGDRPCTLTQLVDTDAGLLAHPLLGDGQLRHVVRGGGADECGE